MDNARYCAFVRSRITELRLRKDVSELRMSLDLGKSGSYIRGITSGKALPSLKELFRITEYFGITPSEFFAPLDDADTPQGRIAAKLREMSGSDLEKLETFINWLGE